MKKILICVISQIKKVFNLDCTANPKSPENPLQCLLIVINWVNCSQNYRIPSSPPETRARFAQEYEGLAHIVFLCIFMRNTT